MKTVQHSFFKAKAGVFGLVCLIALSLSSCLKDNDDNYVPPAAAAVSIVNALPGSQPVDVYFDQNLASTYSINYGNGQDYVRAYIGKRTFAYYTSGTRQMIKSDTTTLQADKFYTTYLTGTAAQPDILVVKDTLAQPATGKASIRLVNVSANAPTVNLVIRGGATLATAKAYKGVSGFVPVQGNTTYTLDIVQAGTSTVLASITDANLKNSNVYTVWLRGSTTATDANKLTAGIQTNAYFN
jgi:hypothetical protein